MFRRPDQNKPNQKNETESTEEEKKEPCERCGSLDHGPSCNRPD